MLHDDDFPQPPPNGGFSAFKSAIPFPCHAAVGIFALMLAWPGRITAQPADAREVWTVVDRLPNDRSTDAQGIRASKFKSFQLNHGAIRRSLATAPDEKLNPPRALLPIIALPMPDGTFARFRFIEAPVMAPELGVKFPEIKTYVGEGMDDPHATVRFDLTPEGFHAQILSPNGAVYIDPAFRGENGFHTSYYKWDYARSQDGFQCLVEENLAGRGTSGNYGMNSITPLDLARSGGNLRTYRLAVAATGEYTAYHGGTLVAGMSAVVTAVNRVNGVYETELAIRMVLVGNNDLIVYTNSGTDPFANNSPSSLLSQNQSTLDSVIGSGNYDIGHVFSTAGGGLAGLGVVCVGGVKARGETGTSAPIGDPFYIDYVAHEIGHQFGANHTFNSSTSNCGGGNRNASTAYEQGSGSTIMAYAGICAADDLQPHSDPFFHFASFDEILSYSTAGPGNNCAVISATGNTAPTVSAGANFTIPQNTPFTLTATGSDPNSDPLTYCWEEHDLGSSTTVTAPDNGSSPLFRSWNPTTSPSRVFPRLEDLLNNTLAIGEVMPTTTRTMNFRVTARDNRAGGGGVNTADMQVNVTAVAGPFFVTSHNNGGVFSGLQAVTWSVAGTTNAPVSATSVNILLSTNGGLSFPITLVAGTANDGSQTVVLPNLSSTTARLKVEAAGNIFFDVCDTNFSVIPGVPTPVIVFDSVTLATENCSATNHAIDPGETVTLAFALRNTGSGDTTNLVAALLLTNGVVASSPPQNYGALVAGGNSVTQSFSFVASGACGGSFIAVLQLEDGPANLGTVSQGFSLGSITAVTLPFTNASTIAIPLSGTKGSSSIYPSTISVAGVAGVVSNIVLTLTGLNHAEADDLDILLVGPDGQNVLLMSDAGGANGFANVTLTFDDAAINSLPNTAQITSGTYKPTNFDTSTDALSAPAPGGLYGTTLSTFAGSNPNGTWSLYIDDDHSPNSGSLVQGWQLNITYGSASCCTNSLVASDLVVSTLATPGSMNVGSNVSFTINVTNLGPNTANDVLVTDALPAGVTFVSVVPSQGAAGIAEGIVTANLGSLASSGTASITIQATAVSEGVWTNAATVACATLDPISTNNSSSAALLVNAFPTITHIEDMVTAEDSVAGPLAFTIGDIETPAASLLVTVSSSNPGLVPSAGWVLDGSDSNRSLTITPSSNQSGSTLITLFVADGQATNSDSFTLTVNPVNDAPLLGGIADFTLVEGETLTFGNFTFDVDTPAQTLAFSLADAPVNASINPSNGVFSWITGELDGPGTNVISVIVTDDGVPSLSATQTFSVIVLETNSTPTLAPIADYLITEGDTLTFTNVAADADLPANSRTFTLAGAPTNATIEPNTGVFTWPTTETDGPGTNVMFVVVTDDGLPSLSATQSFTVIVLETNARPELAPITDFTIFEGELLTFTNVFSDSGAPPNLLTFTLLNAPTNATIDPTNGVFTWPATETDGPGTNVISVILTEDGSPSMSVTQNFTVIVLESNSPPTLTAIADHTIHAGMTLSITNVAGDTDLPPNALVFSLDPGAPASASTGPVDGVFNWTPSDADADTVQSITVRLSDDGSPPLSDAKTFLITVLSRPIITSVELTNGLAQVTWTSLAGQAYRLQFKTNLDDASWFDATPDVVASGPSATQTNEFDAAALRLYRVMVVP